MVIPVVALLHYFTQKWMDKRDGHVVQVTELVATTEKDLEAEKMPPMFYAILPVIPLSVDFGIQQSVDFLDQDGYHQGDVYRTGNRMLVEYLRLRDGKKVLADIQVFFDGLGMQMANVITLIVAGETFAKGLVTIGTIDTIIHSAQTSGFGAAGMILVMITIIAVSSVLMGSGNAPFFAFAALTAHSCDQDVRSAGGYAFADAFCRQRRRAMSPITAVIVVSSSMGGVSPFDVVKRTAIPMAGALITLVAANFLFFYK